MDFAVSWIVSQGKDVGKGRDLPVRVGFVLCEWEMFRG